MTFNPKIFFDRTRAGVMGPTLDNNEVSGSNALLKAVEGLPVSWVAKIFGTTWHETAHTMQPVKEYGGNAYFFRMYDKDGQRPHVAEDLGNNMPGDGVKFAGRGLVQITGRDNYKRAAAKLGIPELMDNPDIALQPAVAAAILVRGMVEGWFTGHGLGDHLPSENYPAMLKQFEDARRIVNGTDKALTIANYSMQFQDALIAAGWNTGKAVLDLPKVQVKKNFHTVTEPKIMNPLVQNTTINALLTAVLFAGRPVVEAESEKIVGKLTESLVDQTMDTASDFDNVALDGLVGLMEQFQTGVAKARATYDARMAAEAATQSPTPSPTVSQTPVTPPADGTPQA